MYKACYNIYTEGETKMLYSFEDVKIQHLMEDPDVGLEEYMWKFFVPVYDISFTQVGYRRVKDLEDGYLL